MELMSERLLKPLSLESAKEQPVRRSPQPGNPNMTAYYAFMHLIGPEARGALGNNVRFPQR
jgi:hypothetical protein